MTFWEPILQGIIVAAICGTVTIGFSIWYSFHREIEKLKQDIDAAHEKIRKIEGGNQ